MVINVNFQSAGVTSFARLDPGREGQIAMQRGQGQIAIVGEIAKAKKQFDAIRTERELQLASLSYQDTATEINTGFEDNLYIDGDKIPDSIQVPGGRYDDEGNVKRYPRSQFEPDVKRQLRTDALTTQAKNITDIRARNNFIVQGRQNILKNFEQDTITANREALQHLKFEQAEMESMLVQQGKFDEAAGLIESSSFMTDSEKAARVRDIRTDQEIHTIRSFVNKQDLTEGDREEVSELITDLESDSYSGLLDQEDRISLQGSLKNKLVSDQQEKDIQFEQERGQLESDMTIGVSRGDPQYDDLSIQKAYDDGIISQSKMTQLKLALTKGASDLQKELSSRVEFHMRLDANLGVDHKNKAFIKFTDEDFDGALQQTLEDKGEVTSEDFYNVGLKVMRSNGGIVPSKIISEMRGANRNDADGLMLAGMAYADVTAYAPQSLDGFKGSDFDLVSSVAARIEVGLSPLQAAQTAISDRDMTPLEVDIRKQTTKAWLKDDGSGSTAATSLLRDKLNNDESFQIPGALWAGDAPTGASFGRMIEDSLPIEMISQFNTLVDKHLTMENFNYTIAAQKAYDELKSVWSATNINSPDTSILMPGERGYEMIPYAPRGNTKLINNEIRRFAAGKIPEGETPIISFDAQTMREGVDDGDVSYPIWYMKDGIPMMTAERFVWNEEAAKKVQAQEDLQAANEKKEMKARQAKYLKDKGGYFGAKPSRFSLPTPRSSVAKINEE